jgi:hydroxymethylbilane synthase
VTFCHKIRVGARSSSLSKKQVEEVYQQLKAIHPHVVFEPLYVETKGDKDQTTSLRFLEKTDFFTLEIDEMVLKGDCRVGIHSAKDLPDPLPPGLAVAAITEGVDPADVLVVREGAQFPFDGVVATSSIRREVSVKQLYPFATFQDIRGNIEERLAKLFRGEIDGVVIAEAAIIRLGLTQLKRIRLPGSVAPLQGRLAVTIREDDQEMKDLFLPLHCHESALSRS